MPSDAPITRTLNAILHADIVGYSRLMGEDEPGTYAALRAEMARAESIVAKHKGRIVNTAGDAFLAVFASVNGALQAAVEFQSGAASDAQGLRFRIGINAGDVIEADGDVFGEGVNIAARIQALADPGGIAVTHAVRVQASRDLGINFRDLGERRLKNIAEPVRLFAIDPNGAGAAPGPRPTRRRLVRSALVALGAAGVVTGGLAFVAPMLRAPRAPSSAQPVIAVLPFRDRSIPPDPSYFSEGITEDVIGLLGRFPELLVLSWSAMGALGSNADASRIAELGADYLVSGSLQRTDERLRASIQLSDAEDGHLLWSESYDQPIADIFVIQDEISRAVVEALAVRIERLERQRAEVADPNRLGAYELVLRGRSLMRVPTREDNLRARTAFEDALERDPDYAAAHVGLGWTHRADFLWGWSHSPPLTFREAERHARAAIAADPENAAAHALLADVLRFTGAVSEAEVAIARALELNPSAAVAQAIRGSMVLYEGSAAAAIAPLETARRLDPALPSWTIATLARAYYFEGRYQDAISTIADGTTNMGEDPAGYAVEAAAQAQLGNMDAARRAAEKVRRIYPFFDAAVFARNVAPADTPGRLLEGLRKAGL